MVDQSNKFKDNKNLRTGGSDTGNTSRTNIKNATADVAGLPPPPPPPPPSTPPPLSNNESNGSQEWPPLSSRTLSLRHHVRVKTLPSPPPDDHQWPSTMIMPDDSPTTPPTSMRHMLRHKLSYSGYDADASHSAQQALRKRFSVDKSTEEMFAFSVDEEHEEQEEEEASAAGDVIGAGDDHQEAVQGVERSKEHHRRSSSSDHHHQHLSQHSQHPHQQQQLFFGAYGHVRSRLDYTYHVHYKKERQWLHDSIIEDCLARGAEMEAYHYNNDGRGGDNSKEGENGSMSYTVGRNTIRASSSSSHLVQWLILTVGVQGAGKRHTIHKLIQSRRLVSINDSFVIVDMDEIRRCLPEYSSYVESASLRSNNNTKKSTHGSTDNKDHTDDDEADDDYDLVEEMTGKEAGYIAETIVRAALESRNWTVILDCSLQNVNYYTNWIQELKSSLNLGLSCCCLKIGMVYVSAEPAPKIILDRVRKRSIETGHVIPEKRTIRTITEMPLRVSKVKPFVDAYFHIRNDGTSRHKDDVKLVSDDDDDGSSTAVGWSDFTRAFLPTANNNVDGDNNLNHNNEDATIVSGDDIYLLPPREPHNQQTDSIPAATATNAIINIPKPTHMRRRFSVLVSTEQNHMADHMHFYGKYAHVRASLDYKYHKNYTFERQVLQDLIIENFLSGAVVEDKYGEMCSTPTEPWLVFTAGAMGAGKSYTMKVLVDKGRFPLLAFVNVDPDAIRQMLPEFHIYVEQSPELAGQLTRKEAGYIAEILTLAGLRQGKNVLVDGSLRDWEWYKHYFPRLRKEFTTLKLAILHITAPREAVFQRAAERAIQTGRIVPPELLQTALEQVPKSVEILSPLVDYYAELHNPPPTEDGENEIYLVKPEGETWEHFQTNWLQTCAWIPSQRVLDKLASHASNNDFSKLQLPSNNGESITPSWMLSRGSSSSANGTSSGSSSRTNSYHR